MTSIDLTRARIVHDLEDRITLQPPITGHLYLEDFLALAANLTSAGYEVGEQVQRIEEINAAIDRMLAGQTSRSLDQVDLMTADPEDVADRIRQAGLDRAAALEIANQRNAFQHRLARAAAESVRGDSDQIIRAMRKRFDPAAKVVRTAADRGLTEHTDVSDVLEHAAPDVIDAYRALGPAVTELNAVAGLRTQLTTVAHVGPPSVPIAAFITGGDIDTAENIWRGEVETVQHDLPGYRGSHLANVRRKRLGGPWLALVVAGYTLRLNTGSEAHAVAQGVREAGR